MVFDKRVYDRYLKRVFDHMEYTTNHKEFTTQRNRVYKEIISKWSMEYTVIESTSSERIRPYGVDTKRGCKITKMEFIATTYK